MAKNIMCTKTLSYLQPKSQIKSTLLALLTALLLSACGVKGDLYQTPEQPEVTTEEDAKVDEKAVPVKQLSDNSKAEQK